MNDSGRMITPADAERIIGEQLLCLPIESLPLQHAAGAVLRENIYAERDQPPFDRVAMDGIALRSSDVSALDRNLEIQATLAAGDPPIALVGEKSCIEVMTGAVLPDGCDCVIPVEEITVTDGRAAIAADVLPRPFDNVHRRGSDQPQGSLLLNAGQIMGAVQVAIAAGAGMARVRVSAQPRIAIVSTGNELVEPGEAILGHQIRRSNVYGVLAALQKAGLQRSVDDHVADDEDKIRERLQFHLDTRDILILSGGVSMGRFDLLPKVLVDLGVRRVFHKIAQRPGKPMWFGIAGNGAAVFALPGNPVSTLICLYRYVLPQLFIAMGRTEMPKEKIALAEEYEVTAKLAVFLPVAVNADSWGRNWALPRPTNGSGDFNALARTDGFVQLPPGPTRLPKGYTAPFYRW
ncbi:MAG: molybdopterin molybdotransferase MoeA [Steroidobacteraceae bacterium]